MKRWNENEQQMHTDYFKLKYLDEIENLNANHTQSFYPRMHAHVENTTVVKRTQKEYFCNNWDLNKASFDFAPSVATWFFSEFHFRLSTGHGVPQKDIDLSKAIDTQEFG